MLCAWSAAITHDSPQNCSASCPHHDAAAVEDLAVKLDKQSLARSTRAAQAHVVYAVG